MGKLKGNKGIEAERKQSSERIREKEKEKRKKRKKGRKGRNLLFQKVNQRKQWLFQFQKQTMLPPNQLQVFFFFTHTTVGSPKLILTFPEGILFIWLLPTEKNKKKGDGIRFFFFCFLQKVLGSRQSSFESISLVTFTRNQKRLWWSMNFMNNEEIIGNYTNFIFYWNFVTSQTESGSEKKNFSNLSGRAREPRQPNPTTSWLCPSANYRAFKMAQKLKTSKRWIRRL